MADQPRRLQAGAGQRQPGKNNVLVSVYDMAIVGGDEDAGTRVAEFWVPYEMAVALVGLINQMSESLFAHRSFEGALATHMTSVNTLNGVVNIEMLSTGNLSVTPAPPSAMRTLTPDQADRIATSLSRYVKYTTYESAGAVFKPQRSCVLCQGSVAHSQHETAEQQAERGRVLSQILRAQRGV